MSWKITSTFSIFLDIFLTVYQLINNRRYKLRCIINEQLFNCYYQIEQLQIAANLIHVMCVLLCIFGLLILCNLDGNCVPFYRLSNLSKVAKKKNCQINVKNS